MEPDLTGLDATATLARAEDEVRARRQQGLDRLRLVLHWADLHSEDPQARPGAVPVSKGGDRLITLGGEGTPQVAELCWAELAIALQTGVIALRNQAGQALDLRHRLPGLWTAVQELRIEPWVALKVASMTRDLTPDQAALVDTAVSQAVEEGPGRILALAEAKTIEADLEGYRTRLAEEARRTGLWVSRPRPGDLVDPANGEPGNARMTAKLPAADILEAEANVEDLADALATHADVSSDDVPTRSQLRTEAFTLLLTNPHAAVTLLNGIDTTEEPTEEPVTDEPAAEDPVPMPVPVKKKRRPATIVVHVTDQVLAGQRPGIARAEGIGPVLLDQVADLVQHREVTVQPVIDLNTVHNVNSYEHPTAVKQRTLLRTVYDVFPHSASRATRRLDHDHPTPYGPPGQTGDDNDAPLTRYHHRAKTHHAYRVDQLGLGAYRWITPHGLARLVTPTGTRRIELLHHPDGTIAGELHPDPTIKIALAYDGRKSLDARPDADLT